MPIKKGTSRGKLPFNLGSPAKKSSGKKSSGKKSGSSRSLSSFERASIDVDKNKSISVRKIENGFIVNESGSTGKGRNQQYWNKEYFSQTDPISVSIPKSSMKFGGKK